MPAATVVRRTRLWSRNGTTCLVRICRPWCATHEHPARPAESAGRATAVAATSTAFGPDVVGARLYAALMGMLRNLFRSAASSKPATLDAGPTLRQGRTDPAPDEGDSYWYVPADAAAERFLAADGLPALHLVPYRDSGGENVFAWSRTRPARWSARRTVRWPRPASTRRSCVARSTTRRPAGAVTSLPVRAYGWSVNPATRTMRTRSRCSTRPGETAPPTSTSRRRERWPSCSTPARRSRRSPCEARPPERTAPGCGARCGPAGPSRGCLSPGPLA